MSAWMKVEQAQQHLAAELAAVQGVETLSLEQALGRVAAESISVPRDVPAQANSAMDGYALRHADLFERDSLPVSLRVTAGMQPPSLAAGSCARIFTGAVLPAGADTVVMQEHTELVDAGVRFLQRPEFGANVRPAGHDLRQGELLIAAGRRLGPVELATLAACGLAFITVRRRPRVVLLSTGDELLQVGQSWRPGALYDSNSTLIAAVLRQWGCEVICPDIVPDRRDATRAAFDAALAMQPDLIVSSGGVSVGEEDHVQALLQSEGRLAFWKIALRPGKPLCLARWRSCPYLGLPGNPLSALVTLTLVCRDAILGLCAQQPTRLLPLRVSCDLTRRTGEREEILAARQGDGAWQLASHLSSGALAPTLASLAWIGLPAHTQIVPGDQVDLWQLKDLLSTAWSPEAM